MGRKSLNRRDRGRQERKQRIVSVAMRLFAERGFAETRVEDITEAADVGKGTFFNYFPSKEAIFLGFGEAQRAKVAAARLHYSEGDQPFAIAMSQLARHLT